MNNLGDIIFYILEELLTDHEKRINNFANKAERNGRNDIVSLANNKAKEVSDLNERLRKLHKK